MSCTKWHQSLTDLLASSQQAQVGCSLLSQSLFFVVTVSTAPLRQRKATVAGGQRAGLYSLLHRYKLCFRLRNNSGLKHCKTISSEEGRVAVWDHASYGVTHCTPAQPPTVSILRHPSTKGDTLHNAVTGSLTPRGHPLTSGGLSTPRVLNSRNPGCTPGSSEPRGCGNALSSFYTIRTAIILLLAQKY